MVEVGSSIVCLLAVVIVFIIRSRGIKHCGLTLRATPHSQYTRYPYPSSAAHTRPRLVSSLRLYRVRSSTVHLPPGQKSRQHGMDLQVVDCNRERRNGSIALRHEYAEDKIHPVKSSGLLMDLDGGGGGVMMEKATEKTAWERKCNSRP